MRPANATCARSIDAPRLPCVACTSSSSHLCLDGASAAPLSDHYDHYERRRAAIPPISLTSDRLTPTICSISMLGNDHPHATVANNANCITSSPTRCPRCFLFPSLPNPASAPSIHSRAALSHQSDLPGFTILRYAHSALICTGSTLESLSWITPTLCTSQSHTASADHNHVPLEFGADDVLTTHL